MLPHRNSTNPHLSHASPHPTSGSYGGGWPLSFVNSQKTFPPTTAQAVQTESPQTENVSQDIPIPPPMPPRPLLFPEPLPRSSLKRKSTRRNANEPFGYAPGFPSQVQPPDIMMPSPRPLQIPVYPHPIQPPQPVPGEGVGGFTHFRQYTADAYRLDAMPSPYSDSGSRNYKPGDVSGGIHADVWPTYNKISEDFDQKKLDKWNKDLDLLLIFVSPISGGRP